MLRTASLHPHANVQTKIHSEDIQKAAKELETQFLAEMLKAAGFGKERSDMGGGVGEQQFSSFLVDTQAEQLVKAGGLGLTETFVRALTENSHER